MVDKIKSRLGALQYRLDLYLAHENPSFKPLILLLKEEIAFLNTLLEEPESTYVD